MPSNRGNLAETKAALRRLIKDNPGKSSLWLAERLGRTESYINKLRYEMRIKYRPHDVEDSIVAALVRKQKPQAIAASVGCSVKYVYEIAAQRRKRR